MTRSRIGSKALQLVLALFLAGGIGVAGAQQKFVRGQGADGNKEAALQKAKLSAWKNYVGTLQGAKLDNILGNEKVFTESLDSYMTDVTVVDQKCTGTFGGDCTVSIKVTVNESVIDSRLRQGSPGAGPAAKPGTQEIAFLVIARVADTQTSFDRKVTKRAESTVGTSGSTASADAAAGNKSGSAEASADAVSVTQSSKTVSGGSQEIKRDKIKYSPWQNIDDLQNQVNETLTINRMATINWEDLVANCGLPDNAPFSKDYAQSETGQLPANVRNEVFKKLKDCQIPTIILATIEIDGYRIEPNSGLWLATGNMNLQAYDLTGRFGRNIGAATRTFSGRAEMLTDASRFALANAATAAADAIVNQLNLK
jgi:hypothetical protein